MRRIFKRISDMRYRLHNFWHYWQHGKLSLSLAWTKSDLTL